MIYRTTFRIVAALFVVVLVALAAQAANVNVNCPNGDGGAYPNINAALGAIGLTGPHTINVTGVCNENIYLQNASSITIRATTPGGATIDGTLWESDGVDIEQSRGITLENLDIRGNAEVGGYGVVVYAQSQATIKSCTIQNSAGGVYVEGRSDVVIRNSTIQNNVDGDALDVLNYSSANVNGATIQNNGFGVYGQTYARVVFGGQNSILNNGDIGFYIIDFSRLQIGTNASGTVFSTIQGHNQNAIQVARESLLVINGPHVIQGNGAACGPPDCGGIFAMRNSTLRITGAQITGNQGAGISLQQGNDMGLLSTTITNNTGDGVRVARMSIGDFMRVPDYSSNVISGNGGASVFCDATSLAVGDLSGFLKLDCKNIERSNGQVRPGKSKEPNP